MKRVKAVAMFGGSLVIARQPFYWRPMVSVTADVIWLDWLGVYIGWARL